MKIRKNTEYWVGHNSKHKDELIGLEWQGKTAFQGTEEIDLLSKII